MSESKKLLIGFAVVGGICLCMAVIAFFGLRQFGNQMEDMVNNSGSPTAAAEVQQKIADFKIPSGYQTTAVSMFVYDILTLTPEGATPTDKPIIVLMQFNSMFSGNEDQMEQQLQQAAEQQGSQSGVSMQVVDSFDIVIRGESSTVSVSEGGNAGNVFRQWMAIFEGNNGTVIFMAQGTVEGWDEQLLMDFLKSIR